MNTKPATLSVDESATYPVRLEQRWDDVADLTTIVKIDVRSMRDFDRPEVAQIEASIVRQTANRVSHRGASILVDDEAAYAMAAELLGVDADLLRDFVRESNRED